MSNHFQTTESAFKLLDSAGIFYGADEDDGEIDRWGEKRLNLNDTFAWALAYCVEVPDKDMADLADLFWRYRWCGILYYAATNGVIPTSQFEDNQRFIDFVKHEEQIRKDVPNSSKRAYHKTFYTLGNRDSVARTGNPSAPESEIAATGTK